MAVVALDKLTKVYDRGHAPATDDVTLDIAHGEFMVLLGPSGCGKTTTLRMIAGLESISSGTVSIDGRVVNRVPAKDRDIAMVFQSYALYPHMSVKDNLAFGLKRRSVERSEIERRVADVAGILGLANLLSYQSAGSIKAGRLVPVLEDYAPAPMPVSLLYDAGRAAMPAVRAFIDAMRERAQAGAWG